MPTLGPDFFSSGTTNTSNWLSAQNAEFAPDGLTAKWNAGTLNDWLYMFSWLTSVPNGYYYDFANFVIEIYALSLSQTIPFRTQIILSNFGTVFGNPSSNKNVALTNSFAWHNCSNTDWAVPSYLSTNTPIGIAISIDQTPVSQVQIDSVRMTISYNTKDGFFDPPYGVVRGRRRYVATRNKQTKVILEEVKPRMLRRKAA